MELQRIDNLWKFLGIKNSLTVNNFFEDGINYRFVKEGLEITHHFNPKFLRNSSLQILERSFQENLVALHYSSHKNRFGAKYKAPSPASTQVFFPKELLGLNHQFDMEIEKDRGGHFKVILSPFVPKTVHDILKSVNQVTKILWRRNFFSEGIYN